MNYDKILMENAKEIKENEWLIHMCNTAIVENDKEFINAFNRRFDRFKYLFIDDN